MSDIGLQTTDKPIGPHGVPLWRRSDRSVGQIVALTDGAAVMGLVLVCDAAYHLVAHGGGATQEGVRFAAMAALTYLVLNIVRGGYALPRLAKRGAPEPGSGVGPLIWIASLGIDLALLFVLGSGGALSRGLALSSLVLGFLALPLVHRAQGALVRRAIAEGLRTRSLFLVGRKADLDAYLERTRPEAKGAAVIGRFCLGDGVDGDGADEDGADGNGAREAGAALGGARRLAPDDVVLVVPWGETARIERLLAAFVQAPVAVHLAPDPGFQDVLERPLLAAGHAGVFEPETGLVGLTLVRRRAGGVKRTLKRAIDLVGATTGLLMLAPVMLGLAALVRASGPGPIVYRQLRHGFNESAFEIYKFRSMHARGGGAFRQAVKGDARITPIGRFMRRTNLDELPQLVNVLRGEMSLVGPRPHAAAHNAGLAAEIANYACRHHVKPGLTGWAQVNGLRGQTDDAAMRRRVAFDVDYIRNWTPWLDLKIIWLTVFSRAAYRNAG